MTVSSSVVLAMCLVLAPIVLLGCVAYGLFGFNPDKAQAIRSAEAQQPIIMEEIRRIHIRSPDRFRHDRLDRHPFYISTHIAVWCYAWCIFAGAPVTSNLSALNSQTKLTMATCFIIGSTLVLSGSAMGLRVGRHTLLRGIRDNLTSSMLADDVRMPYTFGIFGMFAIGCSMTIYAGTSFHATWGSLGGWLTGGAASACAVMVAKLITRIRRYERARGTLIDEAVALIERDHVAD